VRGGSGEAFEWARRGDDLFPALEVRTHSFWWKRSSWHRSSNARHSASMRIRSSGSISSSSDPESSHMVIAGQPRDGTAC